MRRNSLEVKIIGDNLMSQSEILTQRRRFSTDLGPHVLSFYISLSVSTVFAQPIGNALMYYGSCLSFKVFLTYILMDKQIFIIADK